MRKIKNIIYALALAGIVLLGYFFWRSLQPVEIVAVHQMHSTSSVLVNHFPFTDKGKIHWWLDQQETLKSHYGIPKPDDDGRFTIIVWDFGEGYKETDGYDRLCFDDLKAKENCIEKNRIFTVENDRSNDVVFTVYDARYHLNKNGEITKLKRESD